MIYCVYCVCVYCVYCVLCVCVVCMYCVYRARVCNIHMAATVPRCVQHFLDLADHRELLAFRLLAQDLNIAQFACEDS